MNKRIYFIFLGLIVLTYSIRTEADEIVDFSGSVKFEAIADKLNADSILNPNNILSKPTFKSSIKTFLTLRKSLEQGNLYIEFENRYSNENSTTGKHSNEFFIREGYVDFIKGNVYLKIGKKYLKWGPGYAFNPSDVINIAKDPQNLQQAEEIEGKTLVNVSYIPNDWFTLEGILLVDGVRHFKKIPAITKVRLVMGRLDLYVFCRTEEGMSPLMGSGFSWSPKSLPKVIFFGENIVKNKSDVVIITKTPPTFSTTTKQITGINNYVLGANWAITEKINMIFEFYHNQENWTKQEFRDYLEFVKSIKDNPSALIAALNLSKTFKNSPSYFFWNVNFLQFINEDINLSLSWLVNVSDGSSLLLPYLSYRESSFVQFYVSGMYAVGGRNSEFGNAVEKHRLIVGTNIYF